ANMQQNLERLRYSTLAPSRYTVYLHPREYMRLEGIVPILQEQTIRALAEELERLNARSPLRRWVHRFVGDSEPEIRTAAADWQVEFLPDPDGDLNEGDLLVDSELVLPARPDLGVGERTRKITTVHTGSRATTLNGRHIPKGYEEVDGTKRENGVETALPDTARIGLADTVFLEFRKGR